MNLIKCPDCSKDVSINAISCPNCGRSMVHNKNAVITQRRGGKYEAYGVIGIILGIILMMIGGSQEIPAAAVVGGIMLAVSFIVFIVGRFM